ncbi:DoxX family protein [Longitalea arenae]|uniref:DoxX family protein n=1 Tax=Longitalea arenae TaxID=2812558 RepID=UPI001967BF14|nr:DoxX family protein [Longitalea arenae]
MKKMVFSQNEKAKALGHLFLRVVFGFFLMINGWDKFAHFSSYAPDFLDPFGIGSGAALSLVVFAELGCGLCIVLGLLTRLCVVPVLITFLVATFIAHAQDGFAVKQTAMLYLFLSLYFIVTGSGSYSLDEKIYHRQISMA